MTGKLLVTSFSRSDVGSKSYLVSSGQSGIIIDPGFLPVHDILAALKELCICLEWIILTHEHFDHCEGTDALRAATGAKLACSAECNVAIIDPKKNLSAYAPQGKPFALEPADVVFDGENSLLDWAGGTVKVFATPGHSPGSVTIKIENMIFTGDTLLTENNTPTHLPGGDKLLLWQSHEMLKRIVNPTDLVFPGHGTPKIFSLSIVG